MRCEHPTTEPVTSTVTGETLAEVCPSCLASLPVGYRCPDCEHDEQRTLGGDLIRTTTSPCPQHQ